MTSASDERLEALIDESFLFKALDEFASSRIEIER